MKRWIVTVLAVGLGCFSQAAESADPVQAAYAEGVKAFAAGDVDLAKVKFAEVLAVQPNHAAATNFLRRIDQGDTGRVTMERQLAAVVIPSVEFRETSLSSAVEYLRQAAATESGGKVKLNVVELYPREFGAETKVTLALSNVPLAEVLRYVADGAGVELEYQKHAVLLKPATP